ncbi:MAG: hypothetical protein KIH64_007155 [Mycobacterium sp.]|nr:hypothetical protein [Mycobacterium sp.]
MGLWSVIGTAVGSAFGMPQVGAMVGGAIDQSSATRDAQRAQQRGTDAGINEQRRQFDLTREDYAPWRDTGKRALGALETEINRPVTSADVMEDPGYMFGLQQGQQALDRKIAAMGGRVSGNALRAAARFGTDYASTGYGAAYQRRQDRLSRLQTLAGFGQTATSGTAAAGQNSTNAISQALQSQGDANAAASMARGNIWADAGNQITALYGRR